MNDIIAEQSIHEKKNREEIQIKNDVIISVQSQKGGVGKTTVALNVAKLLRSEYRVLFFDLDIAGTEALFAKKAPFWMDCSHVVGFELDKGEDSKKIFCTNLVDMYDNYMSGNELPTFKWQEIKDDISPGQYFDFNRINIISSAIGHTRKSSSVFRNAPQLLFDEAHADWFMEMIREIVQQPCEDPNLRNKPLAVVLDSAPGYSGLGPSIDAWLTDMGPEIAKFIFVASADGQDIMACTYAAKRIQDMFALKLDTASLLAKFERSESADCFKGNILDDEHKHFIIRLLDAKRKKKGDQNEGLTRRYELTPLEWYIRDFNAELDIETAWSAIFNRVPKLIKESELKSILSLIVPDLIEDDKELRKIQERFIACLSQYSVAYNDNYALQFLTTSYFKKSKELQFSKRHGKVVWPDNKLSDLISEQKFSSGEMLIDYLIKTHEFYQYHANAFPKSKESSLTINWLEFSPLWLFYQPTKKNNWKKALNNLRGENGTALGRIINESYRKLTEEYLNKTDDDALTWIEQAYLVHICLREYLSGRHTKPSDQLLTLIDIRNAKWLQTVMRYSKSIRDVTPSFWPTSPIFFDSRIFKSECQVSSFYFANNTKMNDTFESQETITKADFLLKRFCQSYNYILRSDESLRLIHTTAKYSYVEHYNTLYQVFAESLFHHVLHVRDVPLEDAVGYLKVAGEQAQDAEAMVKMFFEFKVMSDMVEVVEKIIGKNGWRLSSMVEGAE